MVHLEFMARKLRVQFPGALYHLMSRGNRKGKIFFDDEDRERFVTTLGDACAKTHWKVHAWCLLGNHFHLVVETPEPNLVAGMKWLLGTYTLRFNRRHQLSGHVFSGRYKSLLVSGRGGYLRTLCEYVHLNPVRARILSASQPLKMFRWSSFSQYLKAASDRPAWLVTERFLGDCGIPKDSPAGRREFERIIEARRLVAVDDDYAPIRRGWCLGDEDFRKELLEQVTSRVGLNHYGDEVRESATDQAERIIAHELKVAGWTEDNLRTHRKGDPEKVRIALRLRGESTVTLAWIAARLTMGTRTHLAHLLYWNGRERPKVITKHIPID